MVSYDHYRVFCCAARHHSFSRAAQELMTSQPAVSRSVAALEQQLQCRLFQCEHCRYCQQLRHRRKLLRR